GALQASLAARKFVVAGIYWPSKAFPEAAEIGGSVQAAGDDSAELEAVRLQLNDLLQDEACAEQKPKCLKALALLDTVKSSTDAQDEFVDLVLSLLDDAELDPTEGLDRVRATQGSVLLDKLKFPIIVPTGDASDDEGGVASVGAGFSANADGEGEAQGLGSLFGSVFGRIGQFLNPTTWYLMKSRSGTVGSNGVAPAVRALKAAAPSIRIHLVGHSLGGYLSLCRTVIDATGVAGLVLVSTGPGFRDPAKRQSWSTFIARYADRHGIPQAARGIAEQPDGVVLDGLAGVGVPVLVVVGGDDARYHAGCRIIVDEVPDCELVVVDGAGHFPHLTHADLVGSHVREFLGSISG
ncbi:MAG: alpha/beta hydrolase, partial [Acidimicrobiales bacterium]|nr:alpha/beta hydrolase [Acidimicrobiales bacterium]